MAEIQGGNPKVDLGLKIFIGIDLGVMLMIFLHSQFGLSIPWVTPRHKLNNPLAALLVALFLRGLVNPGYRETWLARIRTVVLNSPQRLYLLGGLLAAEGFLEFMWFRAPEDFRWNLNAEQGYGTHFSTLQLFLVGLVVLICSREEGPDAPLKQKAPWYLLCSMYFYIGFDDCVGIHENFIIWSQKFAPNAKAFHFVHEWLWFYGPFALAVAAYLVYFFLKRFMGNWKLIGTLLFALSLWVGVLVLEGVAKNIVDPVSLDASRFWIGVEEGFEMVGATLFLFGFSQHLIASKNKINR
ncbi:MAG: hypothetical protein COV67_14215 [Nitrospinae bacterium CG11_big_fil_rev_8_21_14_0_20_56_8]|nr:MAG: hypothetical protein COV67_14215 [Nitrospinae bacterium CG11_big_fil_rev_8_21_14_0_20_56_8]